MRTPARPRLSDAERASVGEIGKRSGRKARAKVAQLAKPHTSLGLWRNLVAQKFDGFKTPVVSGAAGDLERKGLAKNRGGSRRRGLEKRDPPTPQRIENVVLTATTSSEHRHA